MLPQIIINRICLIMQDRKKGKRLIIGSAIFITLINISVFFVWIPARLQISEEYCISFTTYLVRVTNMNQGLYESMMSGTESRKFSICFLTFT